MDITTIAVTISVVCSYIGVGILGYVIGTIRTQEQYMKLFGNIRKENEGLTEMLGPWVKLWDDDGKVVPFRRD
jgi:hypothetical protein